MFLPPLEHTQPSVDNSEHADNTDNATQRAQQHNKQQRQHRHHARVAYPYVVCCCCGYVLQAGTAVYVQQQADALVRTG